MAARCGATAATATGTRRWARRCARTATTTPGTWSGSGYAKVAELQARGIVHFHAPIRLDGAAGPDGDAPTLDLTTADLEAAVGEAAGQVYVDAARLAEDADIRQILDDDHDVPEGFELVSSWVFAGQGYLALDHAAAAVMSATISRTRGVGGSVRRDHGQPGQRGRADRGEAET